MLQSGWEGAGNFIGNSFKEVKEKTPEIRRFQVLLPCVDGKDAFKTLKVKNLLFFKLSNGTHILSHTSIKLFA